MLKGFLIGFCVFVIVGLLFIFPGETMSSSDVSDFTLNRAYLAKNTEQYARCYNSVNRIKSGLNDVELSLMSEYFNDPRVSLVAMKSIEGDFTNKIKQRCNKTINDYESAYKKAESAQKKSESLKVGWQTFVFGGGNQSIFSSEVSQYSPASARMTVAFNDYVFTVDEAKAFYKEQFGL